jgi:hypothetical protein
VALNPSFCEGCRERGTELGLERALNVRLNLKLSLAHAKAEALEQEICLLRGVRRDAPRRDVLNSPMRNRRELGAW